MKKYLPFVKWVACFALLSFVTTKSFSQSSTVLEEWPFNVNNADSAAVRATGVVGTVPTLQHLYSSSVPTIAAAYSPYNGQALSAGSTTPGDGYWNTANGGPGKTPSRGIYEQFQMIPASGFSLRVDSFVTDAAFFSSSSNTDLFIVYSLSNFRSDSALMTGSYTFASGGGIVLTQVDTAPFPTYHIPLVAGGVTVPANDTLSVRFYFACGSSSSGRYSELQHVIAKGAAISTVPCNIAQPGAITASATSICAGQNGTIYSVSPVTNATSYTWTYSGSGATFTSTTDSVTINYVNTATSGTLSVVANASCGSSTARTLAVTLNTAPTNTITTANGNSSICGAASVTLLGSTGTGYVYQFLQNNAVISGATNATYVATTAGTYRVKITANGCSDTSAAFVVTAGATPPVVTIAPASAQSFCPGGNVVLSYTKTTGFSYQWLKNGAATSDTLAADTVSAAGSYAVRASSAPTCADTSAAVVVTLKAAPGDTVTAAGATTFCAGGSVVLNVTNTTGATYQWLDNGVAVTSATTNSYTASASGHYSVIVIGSNTCTDTSAATAVTANPLPVPVITENSMVLSTGPFVTYQWKLNGTNVATTKVLSALTNGNGVYTVTVTDANGCTGTSAADTVTDASGVAIVAAIPVMLYPNPATDVLYINAPVNVNIAIAGIDGRVVLQQKNAKNVNISALAPGMYLVTVYDENNALLATTKMVKN